MTELQLGNKNVGDGHPAFIIAEIGINHQGDVSIAKNLIQKAKECGADAVKLQKRSISRILTKSGLEMAYDNRNSFGKTYGEHKIALELSEADYHELNTYCKKMDIIFCASGWDEESIDFLDEMGIPFFKMASADLTNFPLLVHTAKKNKPMILSTGMADMKMVQAAYSQVNQINNQIAILQCTSTYPSAFSEVHLNVLQIFMKEFPDTVIGYSGHEQGIAIPPAAVALGAKIIERHFTLDRTMKGGTMPHPWNRRDLPKWYGIYAILKKQWAAPKRRYRNLKHRYLENWLRVLFRLWTLILAILLRLTCSLQKVLVLVFLPCV